MLSRFSHVWLCNLIDCSLPGSSVHGISQAGILESIALSYTRGPSQPRDRTHVSCIGRWILYCWATRSSIHFSHSVVSDSLWPHALQHARLPCPSPTHGACSNSCPSSQWCYPTILSSVIPSPPAFNLSQHQSLLKWVSSLHQVAKVLEFQFQHQFFQCIVRTDLL